MGQSPSLPFRVTAENDGFFVAIKLVLTENGEYGDVVEMTASDDSRHKVTLKGLNADQHHRMRSHGAYLLKLPGNASHVNIKVKLRASKLAASALANPEVLDQSFATRIKVSGT